MTIDCASASVLNLASEQGTVAVLYGDNLVDECKHLKTLYAESTFKICVNDAGDDEHSEKLHLAREAARAIGAVVAASGDCAFDELYRTQGYEEVRRRLEKLCTTEPWGVGGRARLTRLRIPSPIMPWPHRFDGASLLENVVATIQRHVVIADHIALVVALWVIHTHVIEAARFSPLLAIVSPEHATGKATLLNVLRRLCRKPYKTAQISPGQLLQMLQRHQPTMLFEDGDSIFRNPSFVTILNSSHDRAYGGVTAAGKGGEFEALGTFFAKAVKSHVGLPESIKHRAIPIRLQRKRQDENIAPFVGYTSDPNDELTALHSQIVRWAHDHLSELTMAAQTARDLGSDRINDTFSPLMAIAGILGGDVTDRVEAAARQLLGHDDDVESEGARLLGNIREILMKTTDSKIPSSELVEGLCARDDWPWAKCNRGSPLDQVLLAAMLKPYGIEPERMRIGAAVKRGYRVEHLRDAFSRYLTAAE